MSILYIQPGSNINNRNNINNNNNRNNTAKHLLELNDDILINIFELVNLNFRLINRRGEAICEYYNLTDETKIFESVDILNWGISNGYKLSKHTLDDAINYGNLHH